MTLQLAKDYFLQFTILRYMSCFSNYTVNVHSRSTICIQIISLEITVNGSMNWLRAKNSFICFANVVVLCLWINCLPIDIVHISLISPIQMDKWTDRQMEKLTNRQMDGVEGGKTPAAQLCGLENRSTKVLEQASCS